MAVIEKFLGQRVEVPEDRRYDVKQGLWGQCADPTIVFGLTQPALVLLGGVKDVEWLVDDNHTVQRTEAVLFAITGKILYLEAPVAGKVWFHRDIREDPSRIPADPYQGGWLFRIEPEEGVDRAYASLSAPETYVQSLRRSEGGKNPEGIKGGVSGICKAVYTGIGEQKIEK
jgi:glycine cleavage system H lipoate-binding protein